MNNKTEKLTEALRLCADNQCNQSCPFYIDKTEEMDCISRMAIAAADCIEAMQQERSWIPVTERLPENDDDVMILVSNSASVGYYCVCREYWVDYASSDDNVTHWMPLPELPQEASKE